MRLIDAIGLKQALVVSAILEDKKTIEQIIDEQPTIEPEQRWIPVSERLPRQGQEVICQCRANIIKVLKLDANGDWYQDAEHCYMSGFVVAWILLPELYQGGDGNETRINNRHQS